MENVTVISMHATYGLALFLFFAGVVWKGFVSLQDQSIPPSLPFGKISVGIYQGKDLWVALGIVGFYYVMFLLNATAGEDDENLKISALDLILNIGLQFFLAGLVMVLVIDRMSPIQSLGLRWEKWRWVFVIAPATVLIIWSIFAGLYEVGYQELMESLGVKQVQDMVELFNKEEDISVLILMSLTAVIVAPLCEEVVFRGYLYPVLSKFSGPWMGWIISALVFSAAHGSLVALVPLFVFGLVLVLLYEWTGSIWAPIAVHLLFNGATVAVQISARYLPESMLQ